MVSMKSFSSVRIALVFLVSMVIPASVVFQLLLQCVPYADHGKVDYADFVSDEMMVSMVVVLMKSRMVTLQV